jgi:hypothetical protein
MRFKETIAYSENLKKNLNLFCAENAETLTIKYSGIYS